MSVAKVVCEREAAQVVHCLLLHTKAGVCLFSWSLTVASLFDVLVVDESHIDPSRD